ncbi:MAG: MBL fold metallo-hydrolase [Acidobacteria bacterium]|nr:MBL fold metallo-hydrolase [Acidobacteriota bacterium]
MKRVMKIVGFVLLLLIVVAVALIAPILIGRRSMPDGFELDNLLVLRDGMVGVGFIPIGEYEVALIDAGNDPSGQVILDELARRKLGPEAVSYILVTHGHPDHIAAVSRFPNAQVYALAAEVPLIEGRASARGPLPRLFPTRPTGIKVFRALRDGDTVEIGMTWVRVYAVPGHTAGSAAYLVNGTLFMGDAADASRDGTLVGAPWIFSDSQAENRASLVRLSETLTAAWSGDQGDREVRAIVFSHSGALTEGLGPLTAFAESNP